MRKPFMVEFTGTPEAGKTTSIQHVCNMLGGAGYSVAISKESAEALPEEIPKGTPDANLWMHYQTQACLLKSQFFQVDILLIDRGLVDSNFYGKKFLWEGAYTEQEYEEFRKQFNENLFPDFLIVLMVPPEVSIQRRGGEGRLVNREYVKLYNDYLIRYYNEIEIPKTLIDTSKLTQEEMTKKILTVIKSKIP